MENQSSPPPPEFYQTLPKVELHRHLEGSLRIRTMIEVSRAHDLGLVDTDNLRPLVQVRADDPYTSQNFLSKFKTLRKIYRSPEIIMRVTREAIADAAADNVRYMELRFTPVALSRVENFSLDDVIKWVVEATRQAEVYFGIITRLIVSVNRHESVDLAAQVIELAVEQPNGKIVGVDLAGDETQFPASPFADLFQKAKQAGLHVTLHSGEWGGGLEMSPVQLPNSEQSALVTVCVSWKILLLSPWLATEAPPSRYVSPVINSLVSCLRWMPIPYPICFLRV